MEKQADAFVFGLLGKSLKHSFSKQFFTEKFAALGLPYRYENFELQNIQDFLELEQNKQIQGLNVTIPYKEVIIPYLLDLSDEARKIGAVNTLIRSGDKFVGHNTDAFGFKQMIKPFLEMSHERALILGNGGAAKAVEFVLSEIGIQVIVAARNPKSNQFQISELNPQIVKHCGIIVQTTPLGTFPDVEQHLAFPFEALTTQHLVVDLIYNPLETTFLAQAKRHGATTLNGLTMLHQQAEKAWQLWSQTI